MYKMMKFSKYYVGFSGALYSFMHLIFNSLTFANSKIIFFRGVLHSNFIDLFIQKGEKFNF